MLSEKEAIERLKKIRQDTITANECGLSNNDFKEEIEVYDVILNLITRLEKELKEQMHKKTYARQNVMYKNKQLGQARNKIKKLQKENEEKDKTIESKDRLIYITGIELRDAEKQIELMAEYISNISDCPAEIFNVNLACASRCNASIDKECWIKYFENKVKEEK